MELNKLKTFKLKLFFSALLMAKFFLFPTSTSAIDYVKPLKNSLSIISSPLRWSDKDLVQNAALLSLASTSFLIDTQFYQVIKSEIVQNTSRAVFPALKYFDVKNALLTTVGVHATGILFSNEELSEIGFKSFNAVFISSSFSLAASLLSQRHKPITGSNTIWEGPSLKLNGISKSFPSVQSAYSWSLITLLQNELDNDLLKTSLSGMLLLISTKDVLISESWLSDYIFGALIGVTAGSIASDKSEEKAITLIPLLDHDAIGMTVNIKI